MTTSGGAAAIERELIREGLAAICEEMAVSVLRTSHSETVKSAMDFSTALCDETGQIIAQGVTLPNQLGALPEAVAAILRRFEGDLHPGDVAMVNDPFDGGMHLPDIFVVRPVFFDSEFVGLVATVAHHADLGGMVAGSMSPYAEECFQEGLRIPPVKLYSRGRREEGVYALLGANTRVPDIVLGDFDAQLVACATGVKAFDRMIRRYGLAEFRSHVAALLDYTEMLTRQEIRTFPEGTYSYIDYLDDDGIRDDPVPIAVSIEIRDGGVTLDFTGSSPQVRSSLNNTLSFTHSNTYAAMRALLRSDIPNNAGFFRPMTVKAPRGCILNCVLPAATGTRGLTGFRVMDAIFGALAPALPDRVMGASDGGLSLVTVGGARPGGERFSVVELISGAWGGQALQDGEDGVPNVGANVSNIPVEMLESSLPVRVDRYGYVPDTGGAGLHRGGLSLQREYTFLQECDLSVRSDRATIYPYGIGAGRPGTPSLNLLGPAGDEVLVSSKFSQRVTEGMRLIHRTAGAGGWGDPLDREAERVATDVRNGILSTGRAFTEYGVVFKANTDAINQKATETERDARRVRSEEDGERTPIPSSAPTPLEDRISDQLRQSGKF